MKRVVQTPRTVSVFGMSSACKRLLKETKMRGTTISALCNVSYGTWQRWLHCHPMSWVNVRGDNYSKFLKLYKTHVRIAKNKQLTMKPV